MQARKLGRGNPVVPIRTAFSDQRLRLIAEVKVDAQRGILSTPLKGKAAFRPGWQTEKLADSAAVDLAWGVGGVTGRGLVLGAMSGGLDDLDCDCPEATNHAGLWFGGTRAFGHDGAVTHWLRCRADTDPATLPLCTCSDPTRKGKDALIAELRRDGEQTMAPPSIHPDTGSELEWTGAEEMATVAAARTESDFHQLCSAILLSRYWPDNTSADCRAAGLALIGMLIRGGWDESLIEYFVIRALQVVGCTEPAKDISKRIKSTIKRNAKGQGFTGRTKLIALLGAQGEVVVNQISTWLKLEDSSAPASATDDGLALGFVEQRGRNLRYAELGRGWYIFNGYRFEVDGTKGVVDQVREYMRPIGEALPKQRKRLLSRATISAVSALAITDRRVAVRPEVFDQNPWVLNTPDGLVDLKTGSIRPTTPEDLVTKSTAVGPSARADCPRWLLFLQQIMNGDQSLIDFLQRKIGYALTGITTEQDLTFLCGRGRNGKGVLTNTIYDLLGDYASVAPSELFIAQQSEGHPTALASLQGVRFATASETEAGRQFALAKVKMLTGGDPITARFMRQDFFRYDPTHKLWISSNDKPALPQGGGVALRQRLHLVPFDVVFYHDPDKPDDQLPPGTVVLQRDDDLREKLKAEWPAILRWAIDGCLEWRHLGGVHPPAAVIAATEGYVADEDQLGRWVAEDCNRDRRPTAAMATLVSKLFSDYQTWATASGEKPCTLKDFSHRLQDTHGFTKNHDEQGNWIVGLELKKHGRGGPVVSEEL